jgi:hypothetical protein
VEEDKELLKHIKSLGLQSTAEYQKWCKHHGFGTGLNKNEAMRKKELQAVKEVATLAAMAKGKEKHRPIGQKIKTLLESESIKLEDIQDPRIKTFFDAKKGVLENKEYRDFLEFLQLIDKKSKLLQNPTANFMPNLGQISSNKLLEALFLVFTNRTKSLQPLKAWKPESKNIYRQFASLVRHLYTPYKIPLFFDSAWFSGKPQELTWWFFVAGGGNIRKAPNLPIQLTKKQAHLLMNAPESYSVTQALRYGQIMGIMEDKRLVEAILGTKLGREFQNEEFWMSVIFMFINNPMMDRRLFGQVVDYIEFIKFAPNAPHPGMSMKGRNPQSLLDEVEAWHNKISKERGNGYLEWHPTGIHGFHITESFQNRPRQWKIEELTNSKLLSDEGRAMHHCVSSYKYSASQGRCSIWSLKCDGERMITIEVNNSNKLIVQARGKFNKLPEGKSAEMIRKWAQEQELGINCYGL